MNSAISASTLMLVLLLAAAPHSATAKVMYIEFEADRPAAPEGEPILEPILKPAWEPNHAPARSGFSVGFSADAPAHLGARSGGASALAWPPAFKMATVPEPGIASMLLIGIGLLGLRFQFDPGEEKFDPGAG